MPNEKTEVTKNVEKVKKILSVTDDRLDNYLMFCEENISDKILDRCHIETIPERLNSLIQEFLIEQYKLNENGILEGKKEVSSVKDREQSVNFQTIGGASSISKNANVFLDRNMDSLITYRKIRW